AVINRDPWLQMRHVDKRSAQIFAKLLQLSRALPRRACRPTLQTQEDDDDRGCNDQHHKRQRDRPCDAVRLCCIQHWALDVGRSAFLITLQSSESMKTSKNKKERLAPKNYRPPRPIDVKGGCSPQNNRRKLSRL